MKSTLPMIYQAESIECGLAALTMILQYYHQPVTLPQLRQQFPLNLSGVSIGMLMFIAKSHQLEAKVYRVEAAELKKQIFPLILHWNLNHFVVLKKVIKNKYIIHDPAKGIIKLTAAQLSDSFTGIILQCNPTGSMPIVLQNPHSNLSLIQFIKNLPNFYPLLFKFFIFIFLYQVLVVFFPHYFKRILDSGLSHNSGYVIFVLLSSYLWLRVLTILAKIGKELCVLKIGSELSRQLCFHVAEKIMVLPYQYFMTRHLSESINRFNTVEQIRQIITSGWIEGCWDGIVCIFLLITMIFVSPLLLIVTMGFSLLFAATRYFISQDILINAHNMEIKRTEEQANILENIRAIQPIKLFAKEEFRLAQWKKSYIDFLNSSNHLKKIKLYLDASKEFLFGLEFIFIVLLMLTTMKITMGLLYLYLFYRQIYSTSLINFVDKIHDLKLLKIYYNRLIDIFLYPIEKINLSINPALNVALKVCQLNFKYSPLDPYLFENINFEINTGECVVLVGASGKGKTTLLKLLMGLLPPKTGIIELSSADIACVMQQDCLLSGTIAQNISFSSSPNMQRVIYYSKLMCIYDEIMNMPAKFQTLVGDLGATLSGGQKQRILLARALYTQPKILFLDEATSHLDIENEKKVNVAIKSLGITCIMIAHREETIRMADRAIHI